MCRMPVYVPNPRDCVETRCGRVVVDLLNGCVAPLELFRSGALPWATLAARLPRAGLRLGLWPEGNQMHSVNLFGNATFV